MVNSVDFTKRLEKILAYYGLSATAFSEKIQFNRSTISHLLSGRNKPSLEFVMKVVNTFEEVDLYWLLNGKGTFPSTSEFTTTPSEEIQKSNATTNIAISEKNNLSTKELEHTTVRNYAHKTSKTVDRIIIFYNDGSFKEYLP